MMLISIDEGLKLLEKIAYANKENVSPIAPFLQHSYDTGQIAAEIAEVLGLDPKEAAVAGCFHDIGRCFSPDKGGHAFHEITGSEYIEREGVDLGIVGSQAVCDRIARTILPHGVVYEQSGMQEYSQWFQSLGDTNRKLLLPASWNELIIVYSDLTNRGGNRVGLADRIGEIKERDKRRGNPRLKAFEEAEQRLLALEKDINYALVEKKMDTSRYAVL